jgi:hypothetical protein
MEPLEAGDPRAAGPYRLIGRLGSGGMGRVFLGESGTGRRVAVKLVREDLAADPGFRDRFRREAELAMRAGGFWTAPVVDADPDAAMPWIASQYVDGPSLAERVTQQGPLDEREVSRLGTGLAEALASFHRGGLVHRDLKPSNVLLVDDGPRVIDFGISKALETTGGTDLTKTGVVLGTPGFMSPEQALGQPAGPPSDVFSLGSLLVYAATGAGAFGDGASHALLFRVVYEAPDLSAVPDGLRELARDCLQKSPEDRPIADELIARLADEQRTTVLGAPAARRTMRKTVPDADALATTGPQRGSSTATTRPPAPEPRRHRPVDASPALPTFAVEEWGPAVFWRRMRRPAVSALTIDGLLLFAGMVFGSTPAMSGYALVATLLHLLYGLKVSLPLLRARALRVGADGLSVRHGPHTLTVPWRDIASVTFTGEKNKRRLALTAALKEGTETQVPYPLRAGKGALKCTIVSSVKEETSSRVDGLETALRSFAGSRYQKIPAAR